MVDDGSPAGECGEAAWHRPRPLARIMSLRSTVVTAPALDREVFRCLGVRTRSGYGEADVARGGATSRESARSGAKPIQAATFKTKFLQNSKQKCTRL
jgi:hypothetical protein